MRERAPSYVQRERDVREVEARSLFQVRGQALGGLVETLQAARRQGDQLKRPTSTRCALRRCLLDDHMRVGSANAERTYACTARHAVALPGLQMGRDVERTRCKVDRRIRRAVVHCGCHRAMLE